MKAIRTEETDRVEEDRDAARLAELAELERRGIATWSESQEAFQIRKRQVRRQHHKERR